MSKKNTVVPVEAEGVTVETEIENVKMGHDGFEITTCGHINRHHINEQGQLAPLACTLPPGHEGDHYAKYTRLFPDPVTDHRGIAIKMNYTSGEAETYWRNDAGTPAAEIRPDEIEQMTAYQQDLVMQILQKNPRMTAQAALDEARRLKAWR